MEDSKKPTFPDGQEMFKKAIAANHLSLDKTNKHYVGRYMYMGVSAEGEVMFKHSDTRAYHNIPKDKLK